MSRKHNTRHPQRSRSRYPERLTKRGLSKAPQLTPLETLRKRHARQEQADGAEILAAITEEDE